MNNIHNAGIAPTVFGRRIAQTPRAALTDRFTQGPGPVRKGCGDAE